MHNAIALCYRKQAISEAFDIVLIQVLFSIRVDSRVLISQPQFETYKYANLRESEEYA